MIRLRSSGTIPKSFRNTSLHTIVTRQTLLGFHRTRKDIQVDHECTKTTLLTSTDIRVAEQLLQQLDREHKFGYTWNRDIVDDVISREKDTLTSLMPLSLISMKIDEFEQLCWLHNFDMFVATSIEMLPAHILVNGYDFRTWEFPNRGMVEKYMTDMLHKSA